MVKFTPKGALKNNGCFGGKQLRRHWQLHRDTSSTIGQYIYQKEPGTETSKRSSPGGRANRKHWIPKSSQQKISHLITEIVCGTMYAPGSCYKQYNIKQTIRRDFSRSGKESKRALLKPLLFGLIAHAQVYTQRNNIRVLHCRENRLH